jgi:hypothetical protein
MCVLGNRTAFWFSLASDASTSSGNGAESAAAGHRAAGAAIVRKHLIRRMASSITVNATMPPGADTCVLESDLMSTLAIPVDSPIIATLPPV